MDWRVVALAVILTLAAVPSAAGADEVAEAECIVDVGAPFVMIDRDREGSSGPTVGGCLLFGEVDRDSRVSALEPGDWVVTPALKDCIVLVDEDGDGSGYESLDYWDYVPGGATVWTNCEAGHDLHNRVELRPV